MAASHLLLDPPPLLLLLLSLLRDLVLFLCVLKGLQELEKQAEELVRLTFGVLAEQGDGFAELKSGTSVTGIVK